MTSGVRKAAEQGRKLAVPISVIAVAVATVWWADHTKMQELETSLVAVAERQAATAEVMQSKADQLASLLDRLEVQIDNIANKIGQNRADISVLEARQAVTESKVNDHLHN